MCEANLTSRQLYAGDVGVVSLENVFLHVTHACNLRCRYCYFSAHRQLPDEMALDDFVALWPQIVACGPKKLVFTGGEPLIRGDILSLLRTMRGADQNHRVMRCLNTNGHLATTHLARQLVGLVDEIRVSVDALQARNDAFRGRGSFEAAMRAIDCFYDVGFEPTVLVTLTSLTVLDLEDLLCMLIDRNIKRFKLITFRPIGRGKDRREWRADPDEVVAAIDRARRRSRTTRVALPQVAIPEARRHCGVGRFMNIMPNGDVFPCHVLTAPEFRCGNVREQSLLEICRKGGLLGRLESLDFHDMASKDERLRALATPRTCMGDVYSVTKASSVWQEELGLSCQLSPG